MRYDHKHGEVHTNKLRVFQALPLFIKSWIRVLKIHGMNNVLLKKMDRPNGHLKIWFSSSRCHLKPFLKRRRKPINFSIVKKKTEKNFGFPYPLKSKKLIYCSFGTVKLPFYHFKFIEFLPRESCLFVPSSPIRFPSFIFPPIFIIFSNLDNSLHCSLSYFLPFLLHFSSLVLISY